jgi:2,3-bisphosphoglycerate-independent phosphoglycerate mutase
VCPDHPTFLRTRTHSHGDCPFAFCGTGVAVDTLQEYNEVTANQSDLCFPSGWDLMGHVLSGACEES